MSAATELVLSNAEYMAMQDRIELIGRLVRDTDMDAVAALIRQAETADTIGPVLDGTAWSAGHERLRLVIDHARALATFHAVLAKGQRP